MNHAKCLATELYIPEAFLMN